MKAERVGQIKCSRRIINHRGVKEAPYPRKGSRGDSFLRKRRERISGLFVIPSCMRCKFFYGNSNRCINNKECSGRRTDKQKVAKEEKKNSECYYCPYGKGYCFPCMCQ